MCYIRCHGLPYRRRRWSINNALRAREQEMTRQYRIGAAQTRRRTSEGEEKYQPSWFSLVTISTRVWFRLSLLATYPHFSVRNTVRFTSREHLKTPLKLIVNSREWYFTYFLRKSRPKVVIVWQVRFACHTHLQAPPLCAARRLRLRCTGGYARDSCSRSELSPTPISIIYQGNVHAPTTPFYWWFNWYFHEISMFEKWSIAET